MNVTIEAYNANGFKMTFQDVVRDPSDAHRFAEKIARAGFTATPPDGTRKKETITTVIRREQINTDGSVTPVVDLYPAWGVRDYGQFRFSFIYLNSEEAKREFEERAGVKLADLPLYSGQIAYKRNQKRRSEHEVSCRPFIAYKQYMGEKDIGGKIEKQWKFIGYGEAAASAVPDPVPAAPPAKPTLPPQTARPRAALPVPGQIRAAIPPTSAIPINQGSPLAQKTS